MLEKPPIADFFLQLVLLAHPLLDIKQYPERSLGGGMKNPGWVFVIAMLLAQQGFADHPVSVDERGLVSFRDIDSDRNGYVSRVEARSVVVVENAFDSADANGDGLLDRREYRSVRPRKEVR